MTLHKFNFETREWESPNAGDITNITDPSSWANGLYRFNTFFIVVSEFTAQEYVSFIDAIDKWMNG